jgi:hypothetical protein
MQLRFPATNGSSAVARWRSVAAMTPVAASLPRLALSRQFFLVKTQDASFKH